MSNFKPDIGTVLRLETESVITGATVTIQVLKPSGATASWAGTINADTKSIDHTIATGDLTESGDYRLQAKVVDGASVWYGKTAIYTVKELFT